MKTRKSPETRSLLMILLLTISMQAFPQNPEPMQEDCSSGTCIPVPIENGTVYTCYDRAAVLYAVDPNDESVDLTDAFFQWYVYVRATESNGWVEGWVEAIDGYNNRFEEGDNGSFSYYCSVSTVSDGSWDTPEIYVTQVNNYVSIGSFPENQEVCPGDTIELYATGSGSYATQQWEMKTPGEDWEGIGEYSNLYKFEATAGHEDTHFRFRISNACNSVASPSAGIYIHDAPNITGDLADVSKCEGSTAAFAITAVGSELSYTWERSANSGDSWTTVNSGGKYLVSSNNLSISDLVTDLDNDLYRCQVTGICGFNTTSGLASLDVLEKPYLLRQPESLTSCLGEEVILSARAGGTLPITYQWRKGGISVSFPSTDTSLVITDVSGEDAGNYLVRLSNQCTSQPVTSDEAKLTVKHPANLSSQPEDLGFCEGAVQSAEFSLSADGDDLDFIWQLSSDGGSSWVNLEDTAAYTGSTSQTLKIQPPSPSLTGNFYRCVVSSTCGNDANSESVSLMVKTAPQVTNSPQNLSACLGEMVEFSVSASGSEPLLYQWKGNNQSLSGWVSDSVFSIEAVNFSDAKNYHVSIKNECNQVGISSDDAELTVQSIPVINLGGDQHLCDGESLTLNAGAGFSKYSWSTGDSTQKIEVDEQQTIEVEVWNQVNCSGKDMINVIIDPAIPALELGQDISSCPGKEVVLNAGDLYDNYNWSNVSQDQSITVSSSGIYTVNVSRNNSVCKVSDTIKVEFTEPYGSDNICLVTTDLNTGYNMIIWEKTRDVGTAAYHIFRQTNIRDKYEIIGTVPYHELSIFTDTIANPEQQQWVYKITAVDTCGNYSDVAEAKFHKPMFLQYQSSVDGVNLSWEKYEVEEGLMDFISYEIYRGSDSASLSLLSSVSSDLSVFKDIDPNAQKFRYFYRVAGIREDPCFPSFGKKADPESFKRAMSNLEDNKLQSSPTGVLNLEVLPMEIFPNPMQEFATVRIPNSEHTGYMLTIRDFSGKAVRIIGPVSQEEIKISRDGLAGGYYLLEASGDKVYRGKLIVK